MIKRTLLVLLTALLLLAAAVGINTFRQGSRQLQVPPAPPLAFDANAVADKLAGAVRFRTISSADDPLANAEEFRKLHAHLQQRFPLVHARLKREIVGDLSLLYTWPGTDPAARGVAFLAHHDVVDIAPGTEGQWQQPPFAGVVKDGYVWGRGTWDNKGNLVAQLEAVELLLAAGFQPRQTVYIVSGADEEVGGDRGAGLVAKMLQDRRLRLEFVLDEGLVLTEGVMPGVKAPVAIVGTAEKGYLSVALKAGTAGGHSSMPPAPGTSAIGRLAPVLQRIEQQQLPAGLRGVAREMFETAAPEMSGFQRVALSNLWLFAPLVRAQLEKVGNSNAMLRTTTALTMVNAGNKENVMPAEAGAVVNFRILPGETRESVLQHVRQVAGPGIDVQPLPGGYDPTPISSTQAPSWLLMQRTLRSLFPDTVVVPGLYIAGSDSRLFTGVTDNIYRFSPVRARSGDFSRLHGTNERISVANLGELVRFYHQLLRNLNAPAP
ncbi:MAG TPA: M20 family peptidase [Ramlibacter sp.]|jgi:carboxypeptidase PM20D1|nr:M20 family peptidase [Ramlibacter sp.]